MRQREREHHHAEMATVVEQRKKSAVQSRQRTDAENDVQQRERGGAERADQQRFDRQLRTQQPPGHRGTRQETRGADRRPPCRSGVSADSMRRLGRWCSSRRLRSFSADDRLVAIGPHAPKAPGAPLPAPLAITRRRNSVGIIQRWRRRSGRIIAPALPRVLQRQAIRAPSLDAGCLQSARAHQRSTARQTAARDATTLAGSTTAASLAHRRLSGSSRVDAARQEQQREYHAGHSVCFERRRRRTGRSQETRCHSSAVMLEATEISGRH